MNVSDYIKQHTDINYCEAIITKDGEIFDSIPSHIYKLIELSGKSMNELKSLIPINASPLEWLVSYTDCIAVWYNCFVYYSISSKQKYVLQSLINNGVLSEIVTGNYTDEYFRCKMLNDYYNGLRSSVSKRKNKTIYLVKR